ncbi:hypothetical protein L3Q82_025274, partial [Scortum barcoo]
GLVYIWINSVFVWLLLVCLSSTEIDIWVFPGPGTTEGASGVHSCPRMEAFVSLRPPRVAGSHDACITNLTALDCDCRTHISAVDILTDVLFRFLPPPIFLDPQVFTIFAFATTGGYSGTSHFTVKCPDTTEAMDIKPVFGYPFRLAAHPYKIPTCNSTPSNQTFLQGDFSSSAEFYVCVGVFGFLYCTATLILYLGYQNVYRQTARGPIIDLVITGAFAFLWLVSSSAWAKGLTDIKWATNPIHLVEACPKTCHAGDFPSIGRLNAS